MKKKLISRTSGWKYLVVFLLGVLFTFAITNAFTLIHSTVENAIQFIKQTKFTPSGLDDGSVFMDINAGSGYIRIDTWSLSTGTSWNSKFLALDASWNMVYASGSLGWWIESFWTAIADWTYTGIQYTGWDIVTTWFISKWVRVSAPWLYATAMGQGTTAGWHASTAMGYKTNANWYASTAMGYSTTAGWSVSTAMGNKTNANWDASTAMGNETNANWYASTAMGGWTHANWHASTAMGGWTRANWNYSTAMGGRTHANWHASTAMGNGSQANADNSLALWTYNIWYTTSLFEIWMGTTTSGANAMTVRDSGDVSFPMLPSIDCLGTDASGTLIAWTCGGGGGSNYYTTGLDFDSGTNVLTLYVSGYQSVTGYILFSGMDNWNSAYDWMNTYSGNALYFWNNSWSYVPQNQTWNWNIAYDWVNLYSGNICMLTGNQTLTWNFTFDGTLDALSGVQTHDAFYLTWWNIPWKITLSGDNLSFQAYTWNNREEKYSIAP